MSCHAHALAASRGMLVAEDVDLIREMVASLPPGPIRIVELGAGSGTTAGAVLVERPDAYLWTIDISAEALDWADRFLAQSGLTTGAWHRWESDSVLAAASFDVSESIDMLLIDSSHEYEHTVAELEAWLPLLRTGGGLIWLHDYAGAYPGVTRAVDEAEMRGEIELIDQRGLGWGGRKP